MADLNRSIGLWQGTGMMLSIVLGAGLLALPGLAAGAAGSAALTIWLVCAAVSMPLLYVFAVVGRDHPDAGGIAAVMKKAFGIRGYAPATLLFLGAVAVGLPSIALVGGQYAQASLGISAHLAAICLIVGAMAVNLLSSRLVNLMSSSLSIAVIAVLLVLAVFGWFAVTPGWEHATAFTTPSLTAFSATFMMVFFAFTGWEVASNLAGEFRNPKRDFPLAMALSFVIAVALYLILAVIVAAAGAAAATEAPFTVIMMQGYGALASHFVSAVAIILIFANLSAALWAVSRMVYSAADERLLPNAIAKLNNGIPLRAVILTVFILVSVTVFSYTGILDLADLLSIAGMNFLLLYAAAAAALCKLSTFKRHRVLSFASILIVALLVFGRGIEHLVYPAILTVIAIASTFMPRANTTKSAITGQV
ncbi:MAG: amino acid permease [Pseudomonadota bacterium]